MTLHSPGMTAGPDSFDKASNHAIRSVRGALTDLLGSLELADVRPTVLARSLEIDKTLAWRISKFTTTPDPCRAYRHLPGSAGVEILLKAAGGKGVGDALVANVRRAVGELEQTVREHGGDRATFEALMGNHALDGRREINLEQRRQLFRASASVWGVQAEAQVLSIAFAPSAEGDGMLDVAAVGGFIGLQRLRPDLPWIIRRARFGTDRFEKTWDAPPRDPIDPRSAGDGSLPLLHEFCTQPTPAIRSFTAGDGWTYDELAPGPVGRAGAVTCLTGELMRRVASYRYSEENRVGSNTLTMRTPVEFVLIDLILHREVFASAPTLGVYGLLEGRPAELGARSRTAPIEVGEVVQDLGSPPILQTPRVRRYREMTDLMFDRTGWRREEFAGYRVVVDYAPAPCDIILEYGLHGGG